MQIIPASLTNHSLFQVEWRHSRINISFHFGFKRIHFIRNYSISTSILIAFFREISYLYMLATLQAFPEKLFIGKIKAKLPPFTTSPFCFLTPNFLNWKLVVECTQQKKRSLHWWWWCNIVGKYHFSIQFRNFHKSLGRHFAKFCTKIRRIHAEQKKNVYQAFIQQIHRIQWHKYDGVDELNSDKWWTTFLLNIRNIWNAHENISSVFNIQSRKSEVSCAVLTGLYTLDEPLSLSYF